MSQHICQQKRAASAPQSHSVKSAPPSPLAPSIRAGTQSGGQALDRKTQRDMSARFGHDFSQVRIHTDSRAGESAEAMGANAFALGSDIVFGAGHYVPGSPDTERLLAHELTHVVQQERGGPGDWSRLSQRGDASEREADTLASQVIMGRSVDIQAVPGAAVARDVDGDGISGAIGDWMNKYLHMGPVTVNPIAGPVAPDAPNARDNPAQKRQDDSNKDQAKQRGDDYPNPIQGPSTADQFAKSHGDVLGPNPKLFPAQDPQPAPQGNYLPPGGYNPLDPYTPKNYPGVQPAVPIAPFPAPPDMTTPLPPVSLLPPAPSPVGPMVPPLHLDPITPPAAPDPSAPVPVPDTSPLPDDQRLA